MRPVSALFEETGRGRELTVPVVESNEALAAEMEVVIRRPFQVRPVFLSGAKQRLQQLFTRVCDHSMFRPVLQGKTVIMSAGLILL
nr:hypothetical protein [uncultured Rhodopila sp.]